MIIKNYEMKTSVYKRCTVHTSHMHSITLTLTQTHSNSPTRSSIIPSDPPRGRRRGQAHMLNPQYW